MKKQLGISLMAAATIFGYGAENEMKFEGLLRLGEQYTNTTQSDNEVALGGMLKFESASWNGISLSAGIVASGGNGDASNQSTVNFFDSNSENYALLSELYLRWAWGGTEIKVGRQALETPFADSDDIGMVPNFFESIVATNNDIADTTITLAHIRSMAGGGTDIPEDFVKINSDKGVQAVGINYEGIENLSLQGWYYYGKNLVKTGYIEGIYGGKIGIFDYQLGLQYANQDYANGLNANVYGAMATLDEKRSGIGLMLGYNETRGAGANNLFGGGPFFTNVEHSTIAEAGDDGKTLKIGAEWNAGVVGIKDLVIRVERLELNRSEDTDASNTGIMIEYPYNDAIMLRAYYNDIKDDLDGDIKNFRAFADYRF